MTEVLEIHQGKFSFRILTDRLYSKEGVWALAQAGTVRVGLSDFVQQRGGDIAFAEIKPAGSLLRRGEDMAVIETIKVDTTFGSPVSGTMVEVNPAVESAPEIINQDPYEGGWLALIQAEDWQQESSSLLSPADYFVQVQRQLAQEAGQ